MKKVLLSAIFLLGFAGLLSAQQSPGQAPPQSFYFGLKATPIFYWANIDDDYIESDGVRIGFTYGLMMDILIDRNYYFATGFEISSRGFKAKAGDTEYIQRLKYIDLPATLKLKTKQTGYMTYYGQIGLLPGFLIGANQDIDAPGSADDKDKRNNQSDYSFFNAGILVGIGAEYNISGTTSIIAGISYNNGFTDTFEPENGPDTKITSNQISLNIGVFF